MSTPSLSAATSLTTGERGSQTRGHGDAEGKRLARAGLAATENVSASERIGQGVDLNGEGGIDTRRFENRNERGRHAERTKGVERQKGYSLGCVLVARAKAHTAR